MEKVKTGYKDFFVRNNFDVPFLLIVICLLTVGLVMMLSAGYVIAFTESGDSLYYFKRQLLFMALGFAALYFVSKVNYKYFKKFAFLAYLVGFVLLTVVLLLPAKEGTDGVKRWISFGPFNIQPSEIAKIALIIYLSALIDNGHKRLVSSAPSSLGLARRIESLTNGKYTLTQGSTMLFVYMIPVILYVLMVFLGSHLSGCIIIGLIGIAMLWLGGAKAKWFVIGTVAAVFILGFVILEYDKIPFLKDYMGSRIGSWLDKSADARSVRWQITNSLRALGSGGLLGAGLGNSKQKYLYVSEAHTDFIFSIICEELGFVGATLILILFVILVLRGIYIGLRAKNRFGAYLCFGCMTHIAIQVLLNVAVISDTIPNTGISLPFFSYGGSALILTLAEMGIVLSVSRQANLKRVYSFSAKHGKAK